MQRVSSICPVLDYVGADTLTVLTSDLGATGSGGAADGQRSGGDHGECCGNQ